MNATIEQDLIRSRFIGPHCRAHHVRHCKVCLDTRTPQRPRPSLTISILCILDALPLEDAWDDLRTDLLRVKLNATPENDEASRQKVARLVRFHIAPKAGEPWRARVHDCAARCAEKGEEPRG